MLSSLTPPTAGCFVFKVTFDMKKIKEEEAGSQWGHGAKCDVLLFSPIFPSPVNIFRPLHKRIKIGKI